MTGEIPGIDRIIHAEVAVSGIPLNRYTSSSCPRKLLSLGILLKNDGPGVSSISYSTWKPRPLRSCTTPRTGKGPGVSPIPVVPIHQSNSSSMYEPYSHRAQADTPRRVKTTLTTRRRLRVTIRRMETSVFSFPRHTILFDLPVVGTRLRRKTRSRGVARPRIRDSRAASTEARHSRL